MRKGENAVNQHFLLLPQCFLPIQKQIPILSVTFILSSANASNLDQFKILLFGKELTREVHADTNNQLHVQNFQ